MDRSPRGMSPMDSSMSRRTMLATGSVAAIMASVAFPAFAAAPTAADFAALRSKWSVMQTGKGTYTSTLSPFHSFIAGIDAEVQGWYAILNHSPLTGGYLWNDALAGTAEVNTRVSFDRLRIMAIAFGTVGSVYENSAALLADIQSSLQWMSDNRYNTTASAPGNWWEWKIGSPLSILDIVIVLGSHLSGTLVNALMAAVDRFMPSGSGYTAANLVWSSHIVLLRACVVEDATKFAAAIAALATTYPDVTTSDGFYGDGSFVQHNEFAYTGSYGMTLLVRTSELLFLLNGTSQAQTQASWSRFKDRVYQSFEPLMYKGAIMDMVLGRGMSRSYAQGHAVGNQITAAIALLSYISPTADNTAFSSMVKYWAQVDTARSIYAYDPTSKLSIYNIHLIVDIVASSVAPRSEIYLNSQFPAMDRVVHRRPNFTMAIAQCSNKIADYESINSENLRGWYTGSGMVYLYNSDLGHYQNDFWPTVNSYRLPGTTVDTRLAGQAEGTYSKSPVGGASSGSSGVTGMRLSAYADALVGKKAWFMFGDIILCAGTRISCTSANTVETIVENRNVGPAGGGSNDVYFNSTTTKRLTTLDVQETFTAPSWINVSGVGGYVFMAGNPTLKGVREQRSGTWFDINQRPSSPTNTRTRTYVTLWLDHGIAPSAQTYAYVMLPGASATDTASYAAAPSISLLENSSNLQYAKGVLSSSTVWGAIFWNDVAYSQDIMSVNTAACVFIRKTSTEIDIALSDPTEAGAKTITLTVTMNNSGVHSQDPGITVTRTATSVTITFNPAGTLGQAKQLVLNP